MDKAARLARWRRLILEQARSGLSLRAFAAQAGVSVNTLAYWKYKRLVVESTAAPRLVPVSVVDDRRPSTPTMTLELGDARILLSPGFDADEVLRLITLLRRPC